MLLTNPCIEVVAQDYYFPTRIKKDSNFKCLTHLPELRPSHLIKSMLRNGHIWWD